jgi:hypothetical protein
VSQGRKRVHRIARSRIPRIISRNQELSVTASPLRRLAVSPFVEITTLYIAMQILKYPLGLSRYPLCCCASWVTASTARAVAAAHAAEADAATWAALSSSLCSRHGHSSNSWSLTWATLALFIASCLRCLCSYSGYGRPAAVHGSQGNSGGTGSNLATQYATACERGGTGGCATKR